jgi:Skp family chaperone for outer membrane proteins
MNAKWMNGAVAGVVVGLALLIATGVLRAQGTSARSSCCVASIDVVKVFNEFQRQKDLQEDLRQTQQALQAENDARRQRIDSLQATLAALDPTDPTAKGRWAELLRMQIDYKNWADFSQAEVEREVGVWTARMYQEILAATQEAAEAQALQIVVYRDEFEPVANVQQVREQIRARRVVYASPTTDLTQSVLDRLNSAYRAQPRTRMLGATLQNPAGAAVTPPAGGGRNP